MPADDRAAAVKGQTTYADQILAEQVSQLYTLAPFGILATVFNTLVVYFVVKPVIPPRALTSWLMAMIAVTMLRVVLLFLFRRSDFKPARARLWEKLFIAGLVLIGMAWGSIGLFPFTNLPLIYQVLFAFVAGGMAAGATAALSAVKWGFPAYSIPALMPLTIHFFLINNNFHTAMGAMLALFGLLLWMLSLHNYQVNKTSLLLSFQNRDIVEDVAKAKEHVEGLNKELLMEIDARKSAEDELRKDREQLERLVAVRTADLVRANELLRSEIEERKQTEQALRDNEERLALAQQAGHLGIFDWDVVNRKAVWTGQLEELFGLPPGGFEGTYEGWAKHVYPDDLPVLEELFRKWREEQPARVSFQYRLIRADGQVRWIAASARYIHVGGSRTTHMVGTHVDITELKEIQERLAAAKEAAEAANLAKSEFLANMSHEIRTPLAGTLGMIDLVLEMAIGPEERQLLEMAKRSGSSLLRLISDLLDFSRLEAGMIGFEKKTFPVAAVIKTAIEVVSIHASEKGLRLTWELDDAVPEELEGDEGRLRQVLVNLLGNSVKFTEKGEVALMVSLFSDCDPPGQNCLLFSVSDTGIGIPPDQQERIFGKFVQADASTTRKYGGAGLGLALSRQIVEKMGGKIWAESRSGGGTIFRFTCPLR